ncbi:MAG: ABC transporter permease [Opitutaceae bacterium]|nr:ABC transporter permease [Opitutaceae bacterium]
MSSLRFAIRQIFKSPGFSAVVVLTLAFGLAVNTMLFGIASQFMLRPMDVPHADRVVLLAQRSAAMKMPHQISFPDFRDLRESMKTVQGMFALLPSAAHLSAEGKSPERAWFEMVTPNAFQTFGLQAQLGRTLLPSDGEAPGAPLVTVLTDKAWRERFGADPEIVGRAVMINGQPFTVVGVMRPEFQAFSYSMSVAGFVPVSASGVMRDQGAEMLTWRGVSAFKVMGLLAPGATLDAARAEAAVVTSRLSQEYPDDHKEVTSVVMRESQARPDPIFSDFMPVIMALFGAMVTLVLVIACANVSNLMLARTAARRKELTVRVALGATRWTIVRQLLTESLVLAAIAGVVAWYLSDWIGAVFMQFAPSGDMPARTDFTTGWRDHAFIIVISAAAALGSGLLPALRASRVDLVDNLKGGPGGPQGARHHRMRNMFVIGQVALSLVVLCSAGLFARSLSRIQGLDLGFKTDGLLMASFDLKLQGYDEARAEQFRRVLIERVQALPGVESAALTSTVPFSYFIGARNAIPENPGVPLANDELAIGYAQITPEFFQTLGLRLDRGRMIAASDTADTPRVAVINQAFADAVWPGQDAIGRRFQPWRQGPWIEVVGLTPTAKYVMVGEPPRPYAYVPLTQEAAAPLTIMVRTQGDPAALTSSLRAALREIDPHLPAFEVTTMNELMGKSAFAFMPLRMGSLMAGVQGVIALLLAIMGLYAVVAFGVTQRTREIGIRMAIGAQGGDVVRAMLREGMRLTLIGIGMGLVMSALLGLVLSKILYGLPAFDAPAVIGVSALLFGIALLACWIPARRATQVNPLVALRAE